MDEERENLTTGDPGKPDGRVDGSRVDTDASEVRDGDASEGVLGALPRTRPQRVSARRAASQAKRAKTAGTKAGPPKKTTGAKAGPPKKTAATGGDNSKRRSPGSPVKPPPSTPASTRARRLPRSAPRLPPRPPAPRQGYEPEEEIELGRTVHPPGPAEVVESVLDIFAELAGATLKSGGRALRDVLSPLRRP